MNKPFFLQTGAVVFFPGDWTASQVSAWIGRHLTQLVPLPALSKSEERRLEALGKANAKRANAAAKRRAAKGLV